jgi:hypothetical protein
MAVKIKKSTSSKKTGAGLSSKHGTSKKSTAADLKRKNILRNLEEIPAERLEEIEVFLQQIVSQSQSKKVKEPKTLKGIWANKGFEKLVDLESEIKNIRKELSNQVLTKRF